MEEPLVFVGIEVPRSPQLRQHGDHRGMGGWEVAGHKVLERTLKGMLEVASPETVSLISGEPDQEVFDLVNTYKVAEADLMTWIYSVTDRARAPHKDDIAIFVRPDVILRDYSIVKKAIEVIRVLDGIDRVEAGYRPHRQPLERATCVEIGADGVVIEDRLNLPDGELGQACPAFEVHRLKNFNVSNLHMPSLTGAAFLWIDEEDFVVLETPLDFVRAELMLNA